MKRVCFVEELRENLIFSRVKSNEMSQYRHLYPTSEKRTVFRERSSRKTASFEEQIMSNDKYPCIFLKTNGDYCVYYPSNIFRTVTRAGSANLSTSIMSKSNRLSKI